MEEQLDQKAHELIDNIKSLRAGTPKFNSEVGALVAAQITAVVVLAPLQRQAVAETIAGVLALVLDEPRITIAHNEGSVGDAAKAMGDMEGKIRTGA